MIGVDHEIAGNDYTYFNICYYVPIENCINDGTKRLNCGTAMYALKRRRGCELKNMYIYFKSRNSIKQFMFKLWFSFHLQWYGKKLPQPKIESV